MIHASAANRPRTSVWLRSMRSMRSMGGGFIFRNRGPSLKVHRGQCFTSMTKHGAGGSPPGAACDSAKPPHDKTQSANVALLAAIKLEGFGIGFSLYF
jgi:hypothetical protein